MTVFGQIQRALARTLTRPPYAVAYSGGGDSTALLNALRNTAALAVIVDHGLSEGSAERTRVAVERARAMGVRTICRSWEGADRKPQQAAARQARYSLIGEVVRAEGIRSLLTGHTLTDAVETIAMSGGAARIRPVIHAPVWPGLRDIDVVRPMLGISRAEVRAALKSEGLAFIDDPANADTRFARVRARRDVTRAAELDVLTDADAWRDALHAEAESWLPWLDRLEAPLPGEMRLSRDAPAGLIRLALASVAGNGALPEMVRVEEVAARGGTLGGARVDLRGGLHISRDPGAVLGRSGVPACRPQGLPVGSGVVWDGRFRVRAREEGLVLGAIGGKGRDRTLPAVRRGGELLASPLQPGPAEFEPLACARLRRMVSAQLRCG